MGEVLKHASAAHNFFGKIYIFSVIKELRKSIWSACNKTCKSTPYLPARENPQIGASLLGQKIQFANQKDQYFVVFLMV